MKFTCHPLLHGTRYLKMFLLSSKGHVSQIKMLGKKRRKERKKDVFKRTPFEEEKVGEEWFGWQLDDLLGNSGRMKLRITSVSSQLLCFISDTPILSHSAPPKHLRLCFCFQHSQFAKKGRGSQRDI